MKSMAVSPSKPRPVLPSYPHLLWFFVPLALSSSFMTLEPLIVNTAISHAPNSELALAAYNVMFGIALVIEAPVIMLVSASTALSRTQASFRRIFRFALILGGISVAVGFLVSLITPLYQLVVLKLMGITPAVAAEVRPALIIMSIWSFPIAWRRMLQGVLISHNRTLVVTAATLVRLAALTGTLFIGRQIAPERMLVVSAIAMQVSVIAESLVVTPPAFRIAKRLPADGEAVPLTWSKLIHFYWPLVVMMVLRQIGRPLLSAGIASADVNSVMQQRSLAAWSVAWSLALLPFGVTLGLEQVAIAKGNTPAALARVRRFAWSVGLFLGGLLLVVAFTPLVHPVLGFLFDLTPEIKPLVVLGLRWMAVVPLIQSLQALFRGIAIGEERTPDARSAVGVGLLVTVLVVWVGPRLEVVNGVMVGALATLLAALVEVLWLVWREKRSGRARVAFSDVGENR